MIEKWRNAFEKISEELFDPFVEKIEQDETVIVPKRNPKSRHASRSREFDFQLLDDALSDKMYAIGFDLSMCN